MGWDSQVTPGRAARARPSRVAGQTEDGGEDRDRDRDREVARGGVAADAEVGAETAGSGEELLDGDRLAGEPPWSAVRRAAVAMWRR